MLASPRTWLATGAVVAGLVVAGVSVARTVRLSTVGDLLPELEGRGTIAVIGGPDLSALSPAGARLVDQASFPRLVEALAGSDPEQLVAAMERDRIDGLLVDTREGAPSGSTTLSARLSNYAAMPPLRAHYLTPAAAYYALDGPIILPAYQGQVVAHVARRVLAGAQTPRVTSFPEPLRRFRNVEVMVMLRQAGRPRLWRSARASSVAGALLTAARAARQRWAERERAMGGALTELLPRLDVEIALLEEDGTLGDTSPEFLARVFTDVHAVAYERHGAWRYMLPPVVGGDPIRDPVDSYGRLFAEHGLAANSLDRSDLRLYRLYARMIGRSPAEEASGGSGSP